MSCFLLSLVRFEDTALQVIIATSPNATLYEKEASVKAGFSQYAEAQIDAGGEHYYRINSFEGVPAFCLAPLLDQHQAVE